MVCETDFDCPGTQICYIDVPWNDDRESFCNCSSWFGWTGFPECTELGLQTKLLLVALSFEVLVAGMFTLLSILDGYHVFTNSKMKLKDTTRLSILFSTLAILCHLCWKSVDILILLAPEKNTFQLPNDENEKYHDYIPVERGAAVMTMIFSVITAAHVSVLWIEVAYSTKHLVVGQMVKFKKYKQGLYLMEVAFAVMLSVIGALGQFYIAVFISYPVVLLLCVLYTVGYRQLRSTLQQSLSMHSQDRNQFEYSHLRSVIKSVRRTALVVIGSLYMVIIAGGIYGTLSIIGWQEFSPVGGLSIVFWANEAFAIFVLIGVCAVRLFAHESLHAFKTRSLHRTGSKDDTMSFTLSSTLPRKVKGLKKEERGLSHSEKTHDMDL
mmetsp:Transcript_12292/g.14116  ORF Transcript_12292/g.14116 Transcript_12292/m.14116 type:complete len:381 (+) Transcript_12292:320-1462(+)